MWEIIARLRELDGDEEHRIETLAEETGLHPRQIRGAVDYAAAHPDPIRERIDRNERAAEESRRIAEQRQALLN